MHAHRTLAALAAAVAVTIPVAGCGSSDEDQIKEAANSFVEALGDEDAEKACDLRTADAQKQITAPMAAAVGGGGDCTATLKKAFELGDNKDKPKKPNFSKITVDGDAATASEKNDAKPTKFAKVDGEWKIDGN